MLGEAEVWRAAVALVRRHSSDAPFAVAAYADQLIEDGNMAAAAACQPVLNAIERCRRRRRRRGRRCIETGAAPVSRRRPLNQFTIYFRTVNTLDRTVDGFL